MRRKSAVARDTLDIVEFADEFQRDLRALVIV